LHRKQLARDAEEVGLALKKLRQNLLETEFIYTAGVIRAAEEALNIAFGGLSDEDTPEDLL